MTSRARRGHRRFGSAAAVAALVAGTPLVAQTAPTVPTSAVARVELSATMLPTARLDGSSRMLAWRRGGSGEEGTAMLAVLTNAPYRLVVYRVDRPDADHPSRRIWIEGMDGVLEEVRVGAPVVIRGQSGSDGMRPVTLRLRAGPGTSSGAAGLPLRYEIQIRPAP